MLQPSASVTPINTPLYVKQSEYKRTFVMWCGPKLILPTRIRKWYHFFAKEQKISATDLKDIIDLIEKEEDK